MSSKTLRILLVVAIVVLAFSVVMSAAYAQTGTSTSRTSSSTTGGAFATATPRTLPATGGAETPASTATVVLLALGATAGLGGLLLRGLRQPR